MIILKNITKTFKKQTKNGIPKTIFKDINLNIEKNDFIRIKGSNGSGKTSLLRLIKGNLHYDSGQIKYKGIKKGEIKIFSQNTRSFFLNITAFQNLKFFCLIKNITYKNLDEEILNLMREFEILDKKNFYVSSMSDGEIKKLILIRGLLYKPKLFLFDEIVNSLDINIKAKLYEKIINLDQTIIWVSHNEDNYLSDHFNKQFLLQKGELILCK